MLACAVREPAPTLCSRLSAPKAASNTSLWRHRLDELSDTCRFAATTDVGLVEGAGGLHSPMASDGHNLDLIERTKPDLVVMVASAALGGWCQMGVWCAGVGGGGAGAVSGRVLWCGGVCWGLSGRCWAGVGRSGAQPRAHRCGVERSPSTPRRAMLAAAASRLKSASTLARPRTRRAGQLPGQTRSPVSRLCPMAVHLQWRAGQLPGQTRGSSRCCCPASHSFNGGPGNCPAKHVAPVGSTGRSPPSMEGRAIARPNAPIAAQSEVIS